MPNKHKDDDLLTLEEVADATGYTRQYMGTLSAQGSEGYDPTLRRIRIKTDETYRRAFNTKVQYVFQYRDVKRWFNDRQQRPTVQAFNETHGIIVE